MPRARIPAVGERVQMGPLATAFRGVKGQVVKIHDDYVDKTDPLGRAAGHDRVGVYIMTDLHYNGKRVVVKASPYELDGGIIDGRR